MAHYRSKMARIDSGGSQDLISNLPEELKSKIVSFLPVTEAVRTSILSSRWRSVWASMPEITLKDRDFAPLYSLIPRHYRFRLIKFVDILLLLHKGPVQKFQIQSSICSSEALDRWIVKLSRTGIRSFSLDLTLQGSYKVPSCLFASKTLDFLHLYNCLIKLPRGFEGFQVIRTIELQNCTINGDDFEKLISNCPLLDELSVRALTASAGMSLAINAPKLKKLTIDANFVSLALKTPHLVKACIELEAVQAGRNSRNNLIEALGDLSNLELLGICCNFLPYLAKGNIPDQIPTQFSNLKLIQLDINLSDPYEANVALLIFQNAPKLEELFLLYSNTEGASFGIANCGVWEIQQGFSFEKLVRLTIDTDFITEPAVSFLKFVLGSAPRLEKLIVSTGEVLSETEKKAHLEWLMQAPKVSRNVQIKFV